MEPTTDVSYEMFDADGKQVMFTKQTQQGAWSSSSLTDETEAKTFVTEGLKLYKRTSVTTFEVVA